MQAALERRDRDRGVQEGRHGDADGVEPVEREQVLPARDGVLDAVLAGSAARSSSSSPAIAAISTPWSAA